MAAGTTATLRKYIGDGGGGGGGGGSGGSGGGGSGGSGGLCSGVTGGRGTVVGVGGDGNGGGGGGGGGAVGGVGVGVGVLPGGGGGNSGGSGGEIGGGSGGSGGGVVGSVGCVFGDGIGGGTNGGGGVLISPVVSRYSASLEDAGGCPVFWGRCSHWCPQGEARRRGPGASHHTRATTLLWRPPACRGPPAPPVAGAAGVAVGRGALAALPGRRPRGRSLPVRARRQRPGRRACRALHESPKCGQPHHVLWCLFYLSGTNRHCAHPMTKEVMADTIVDSRVRVRGIA